MIENHVTNLELSKKLKALGFKQESEFYWQRQYLSRPIYTVEKREKLEESDKKLNTSSLRYSAYLATELGEWLPKFYRSGKHLYNKNQFVCEHRRQKEQQVQIANTETNAIAKMLIYLAENKLIDVTKLTIT